MKKFVVGGEYYPADTGYEPITVVSRTEKYITVRNKSVGSAWRMLVRIDEHGVEYAIDSTYSKQWREVFTYRADNYEREN